MKIGLSKDRGFKKSIRIENCRQAATSMRQGMLWSETPQGYRYWDSIENTLAYFESIRQE